MASSEIVGRVVQFQDLLSRSELNGVLGNVESYDIDTGRYQVRPLKYYGDNYSLVKVKAANFDIAMPSTIPLTRTTTALAIPVIITSGTRYSITGIPSMQNSDNTITMDRTCGLQGSLSACDAEGVYYPPTLIKQAVVVDGRKKTEKVMVEIEDMTFDHAGQCAMKCRASTVAFRRCRFRAELACVITQHSTATFENCLFEAFPGGCGVSIDDGSTAQFVNCLIRNTTLGLCVVNEATAVVRNCNFLNFVRCGVWVFNGGKGVEMHDSYVSGSANSCIELRGGAVGIINRCKVRDGKISGIAVEGPRPTTTATITHTIVEDCLVGMFLQTGKLKVLIDHCSVINSGRTDVAVTIGCMGEIDVNNTLITGEGHHGINSDSGPKCVVRRDSVVVPSEGYDRELFERAPEILREQNRCVAQAVREQGDWTGSTAMETLRALKKAGIGCIQCATCGIDEPKDVKFSRCSRCLNTCYCSKECQKTDWVTHKKDCVVNAKSVTHAAAP